MALIRNVVTGMVWEVSEASAYHHLKFHSDEYELAESLDSAPAEEVELPPVDLDDLKHPELQKIAKELGIPASGTKDELIAAILAKRAENA